MNANENINDPEKEVIQTLKNYFKIFENANVQASVALRIEVIMELFEYILGDINCRMYLLDPAKHKLFTTLEKKLAEFIESPNAQANNRFMTACQALDVFLQNGRILKAEQAIQAWPAPLVPAALVPVPAPLVPVPAPLVPAALVPAVLVPAPLVPAVLVPAVLVPAVLVPAVLVPAVLVPAPLVPALLVPAPIVMNYAGLHAEDEYEDNDDEDEDEDDDEDEEGAPPLEFNRNIMENYIIRFDDVEDDELKVSIALELFAWICENQLIRQALFVPENKDLFGHLYSVLEQMMYNPVYVAAVEANNYYRILDEEIKTILEHLERVLSERIERVDDNKCCRHCDKPLFDNEGEYCLDCELDKFD
jgi:hypothetical protein